MARQASQARGLTNEDLLSDRSKNASLTSNVVSSRTNVIDYPVSDLTMSFKLLANPETATTI